MTSQRKRFASDPKAIARKSYLGLPPILPGEDERAYEAFFEDVSNDLKPADVIEEIWTKDVVDNTWEIARLRRQKARFIAGKITRCLADTLAPYMRKRSVPPGEPEPRDFVFLEMELERLSRQSAPSAYKLAQKFAVGDPKATARVEKLMASRKLVMDDVYARVLAENLDQIDRIDQMITTLEARRNSVFREIDRHRRAFADSLRHEVNQIEDAEFKTIEPAKIAPNSAGDKNAA